MKPNGYFLTIVTPNGNKAKRFVKRLGEALVILTVMDWTEVLIKPLGEKREQEETHGGSSRPIVCVETGERFDSILECSKRLGIPYKAVWNSLTFGTARRGLHFRDANDKGDENSPR